MSKAKEQNDKQPKGKGAGPTRSFDGSTPGPGSQIGPFRIEQELGRGGAGVVYLAHDTKLDRSVAIKSLPPEVKDNPNALSRFTREAKVLASLNHPNIATIHEVLEEAEGVSYLVLEYVPGQTLAERIAESKIKLRDALTIALQIAEAVATAHEHDVIHRDLKPGNIKMTQEGRIKVLDFGLAKVVGGEATDQQSTITEPGRIIGTPAYMSPEQARGKPADKHSDIWSFGCVLYELLTGKVPFKGETVSDTLANILQTEPDWQTLPRYIPASICVMLHRCLEKEPTRRLRDIGDAAIEIRETLSSLATISTLSTSSEVAARHKSLWQWIAGIAFIVLIVIVATLLTRSPKPTIPTPLFSKYPIRLPQNQMLNKTNPAISVSPDGKKLVYVSGFSETSKLILREFDQTEGRVLPETKGAHYPFFSPDGQWIGFQAGGKLKKLYLDGGKPIDLCNASNLLGGSWSPDDVIYFSPVVDDGLWKISANGVTPERITIPDKQKDELGHWWPEVLPGGEAVLYTVFKTSLNDAQVAVLLRETGKSRILLTGASHARYAPTGHLLYAQSGMLMAAPFDLKQLKVGEPRKPVIEGLNQIIDTGYAPFCFPMDGLLYYVRGGEWLARRNIVWVDRRTGDIIEPLPLDPGAYSSPRLSPDGQSIAFTKFDSGAQNIWVCDLLKEPPEKVTFEGNNFFPVWKPDDNKLTFTSYRDGPFDVYWKSEGMNSPEEEPLVTGRNDQIATSWSTDGKVLLFHEYNPETGLDIWRYSIEDGKTEPLLNTPYHESEAVFSPDGSWIAYESDREEGHAEVYVASYPEPVVNKKISTGGARPVWSHKGKELFYCSDNKMMAVTIETEPELKVSEPNVLFDEQSFIFDVFDVSQDGQRFLMIKSGEEEVTQLIAAPNFFEELKRLVPTKTEK